MEGRSFFDLSALDYFLLFDPALHVVCFFLVLPEKHSHSSPYRNEAKDIFRLYLLNFWEEVEKKANRGEYLHRQKFSRKSLAMPQCTRVRNLGKIVLSSDCIVFALEHRFIYENLFFTSLRLSHLYACILRQAGTYRPVQFKHTVF